jgi:hypothetical protein
MSLSDWKIRTFLSSQYYVISNESKSVSVSTTCDKSGDMRVKITRDALLCFGSQRFEVGIEHLG